MLSTPPEFIVIGKQVKRHVGPQIGFALLKQLGASILTEYTH